MHAPEPQEYIMVPPADNPAYLSVTRAFVVQFRADAAVEQGYLAGRTVAYGACQSVRLWAHNVPGHDRVE